MKLFIIFFLTLSLYSQSDLLQLDPKKQNIIVLHSWHDILWDRLWGKGIDNVLGKNYNLIRYDFDAMKQDDKELKKRAKFAYKLAQKYKAVGIIFGDDQALNYAGPLFEGSKYPGVYLGINFSPRKYLDYTKASNITGLLERPLYKTALKKILKVLPKKRNKVLLLSDSPLGKEDITDIAKLFRESPVVKIFDSSLEFQVKDNWEEWKEAVLNAEINGFDAIMVGSRYILKDKYGIYQEPSTDVLFWMSKHSTVPFFGFYEDGIGPEFHAGGWVLGGIEHGEMAGKIMLKILEEDKKPSEINPIFYNYGQYIFSRTMLKKYNLTLSDEIAEKTEFIEDRHKLWDFKNFSFDKGDIAWTPSSLYKKMDK